MKSCKNCQGKNLKSEFIGAGEEITCGGCGLIAYRVHNVGRSNRLGKWFYFYRNKDGTTKERKR
ncbi:hypothetical protein LCGC14_2007150 [marine sediment metagenome]|uniref:Uncharacterized protein n=1 Tax=marine sediment metagenome TaxID=412755 RepID=A0A0F9FNZ5_9ZZZZ